MDEFFHKGVSSFKLTGAREDKDNRKDVVKRFVVFNGVFDPMLVSFFVGWYGCFRIKEGKRITHSDISDISDISVIQFC
jgi:hypothetical protein